jgi:hypothetical protein
MPKVLAKVVQLYAGLDLIGSKQTVNSKDAELEVTPVGVKMTSKKTKREILLPWSNIKGVELIVVQERKGMSSEESQNAQK